MGEVKKTKEIELVFSSSMKGDVDFIPIIADGDDDRLMKAEVPEVLPLLPLRNSVLFPGVVLPITVGRSKSLQLVKEIYQGNRLLGTVCQKDYAIDEPQAKDLYLTGTMAEILKILEMPDGSTTIFIQGRRRFNVREIVQEEPYFKATVDALTDVKPQADSEFKAVVGSLKDLFFKIAQFATSMPPEATFAVKNIENTSFLINFICSNTDIDIANKQKLLEASNLKDRATLAIGFFVKEVQLLELKKDIQDKVKVDLDKQQRDYMLNQQIKTIQNELGNNPIDEEIEELKKLAKDKKWSKEVETFFFKEVDKLKRLNPAAGEYSVQYSFLQTLVELPWNEYTEDNFDLQHARKVLDQDHYGLEKVKERILEHLAVLKLKKDMKSPILCLYGPPGVGKTSLGKSVAKALNRKFARMSLGGLHDESEIRGHRKTYIGAMPGRIIQNIKKIESSNPVFILDEIDKVSKQFHGDPASALLEVLDPEQNSEFHDNYIEVDYDLSKVMFIATANTLNTISPALRDRLEMIEMSGYLVEEKIEIAKRHLIPKQLKNHGLKRGDLTLSKAVIEHIVDGYTRESGVRELDKKIAKIIRRIAKKIAFEEPYNKKLTKDDIRDLLGMTEYSKTQYQGNSFAGVVTGLAWTAVGGQILYVEASLSKGKGTLTLTGNLGDVMKESAMLAHQYIKSHAEELNIKPEVLENWSVHIHVPEGAIPKDGPSAGITMVTAMASAFTQRKVKKNIAMTGEITLRGKVLPVGGIKEKILAAKRAGIKEIILSSDNKKNLEEIKEIYLKDLKFHFVDTISGVLDVALLETRVSKPKKFA